MRATQTRIYLSHLEHNLHEIQKIAPTAKLCLAIKADAYGHGTVPVAKKALEAGVSFLSVATVGEGEELREAGLDAPILLLSSPHKDEIPDIIDLCLTPLVCDVEFIDLLDEAAALNNQAVDKHPVHLKIDTGMGRHGCRLEDAVEIALCIQSKKNLYLEGVCTHLAVSDSLDPSDVVYTKKQIELFNASVGAIKNAGIEPGILHCAASGGILMYPEAHFDMVRPGIIAYGYYPSAELFEHFKNARAEKSFLPNFKPVMELVTAVTAIKTIYSGESVSYGRNWTASEETKIATIPIGYADGLLRSFSPGLSVTIRSKNYPIVGRICMDQCVINVGTCDLIERWDEVIIFGPQENCNTAADIANIINTIPYEILCLVSSRVLRTYV